MFVQRVLPVHPMLAAEGCAKRCMEYRLYWHPRYRCYCVSEIAPIAEWGPVTRLDL
jgi:hypothetical protein